MLAGYRKNKVEGKDTDGERREQKWVNMMRIDTRGQAMKTL